MIHYITTNGLGNTWVGNELSVLRRGSIPFRLHSMRRAETINFDSQWAKELHAATNILYPPPISRIAWAVLVAPFLFGPRFFAVLLNAMIGSRESLRCRVAAFAHFLVGCEWALQLRKEEVTHIHSQWIHSCGSIGMYAAWLLGKPFSFTGHAADLFRDRGALRDKIRRADFIICISEFHREFYLQEGARPEQLHIAYCGIDPELFVVQERHRQAGEPYRVLSSGRLVEKKGFSDLIKACAILRERNFKFECVIAGSGELDAQLRAEIRDHGLGDLVTLTGEALKQEDIPEFMHGGDVYCLPCVWASDNDVDGLPQMLMEAMACGVPAISTRLVGIPDLIVDGETGLLAEPNQPTQIADAIQRLAGDPELSQQLSKGGRRIIEEKFNLETALEPLLDLYREKLGYQPRSKDKETIDESKRPPLSHNSSSAA